MARLGNGTTKLDTHCVVCSEQTDESINRKRQGAQRTLGAYKPDDRTFQPGQDVFRAGEPCDAIYSLVEGWACLYTVLADGRRQIFHFALPGDVLGFQSSPGAVATYSAEALTRVVVCVVSQRALPALTRDAPDLGLKLAQIVSRDRDLSYDHLAAIGRRTAHERVAYLLLELFARYRSQWPGHRIDEMHLPLTQEHIGDATGLTGVHVNRVLRDLRIAGIVEFRYGRLRVMNPDKLMDAAGVSPEHVAPWLSTDQSAV